MEQRAKEQENLSRLERAAQQTADPRTIQQKAEKPNEKVRFSLRKEDIWWMVGFAAVALLLFSENTWLEAIVRYLVPPKEAGRPKTGLIKEMLARLNAEPDRVLFPKSNLR
jgi:hypothetical protein